MSVLTKRPAKFNDQLRRDRWTAVIVTAIILALVGLVLWMARFEGASHPADQFWPLLPGTSLFRM